MLLKNMAKIALRLEYRTSPVWTQEEGDGFEYPGSPEKGEQSEELIKLSQDTQKRYDCLFINDGHEFSYVGFKTKKEAKEFADALRVLSSLISSLYGDIYEIEDRFKYDRFSGEAEKWDRMM